MIKDRDFRLKVKIRSGCSCGWTPTTLKWKRNPSQTLADAIQFAEERALNHQSKCNLGRPGQVTVEYYATCRYCGTALTRDSWADLEPFTEQHSDSAYCVERSLTSSVS